MYTMLNYPQLPYFTACRRIQIVPSVAYPANVQPRAAPLVSFSFNSLMSNITECPSLRLQIILSIAAILLFLLQLYNNDILLIMLTSSRKCNYHVTTTLPRVNSQLFFFSQSN